MAGAAVSTGGAAELAIGAAAAASSGSGGAAGQRQLQPTYGHQKDPQQQQKQLLQLEPTLRHMHGRAAFRQHYGAYNPARPGLSIVLTLLLLLGCLISAVYWTKTGPVVSRGGSFEGRTEAVLAARARQRGSRWAQARARARGGSQTAAIGARPRLLRPLAGNGARRPRKAARSCLCGRSHAPAGPSAAPEPPGSNRPPSPFEVRNPCTHGSRPPTPYIHPPALSPRWCCRCRRPRSLAGGVASTSYPRCWCWWCCSSSATRWARHTTLNPMGRASCLLLG